MNQKTCSRVKCFADRVPGDSLFCGNCREDWIICTMNTGIHERDVHPSITSGILQKFQDGELE